MEVVQDLDTLYFVQVKSLKGKVKVEGYYKDRTLKTEHGAFTYFYPNGQVESRGIFTMGSKSGLWLRYHDNGKAKAERFYDNEVLATLVYTKAEKMPEFPGGNVAMNRYFSKNLTVPKEGPTSGNLKTSFIVEVDGELSQVQIVEGVNEQIDQEAMRILNDMPTWEPGMDKGRAVRVQMIVPIEF